MENKTPEQEEAETDANNYAALDAVASSKGGQILLASLLSDALNDIDTLAGGYKKLSHVEMQGICASLDKNLDLIRVLKRAEKNKKLAREALKEALSE